MLFTRKVGRLEYDERSQVLTVYFREGNMQAYASVPSKVYKAMDKAMDKDFFFFDRIFGQYPYTDATKAFSYIRRDRSACF